MQRRQFLKLALPLTLLAAGTTAGVMWRRQWAGKASCIPIDRQSLFAQLQPFSDMTLGEKTRLEPAATWLDQWQSWCGEDFAQHYREVVQEDFARGHTVLVDGWILSRTEALTHRAVYSHQASPSGVLPGDG